jgi:ATPase subunit of ABC transporter with duplicated ATPase domains
MHLAGVTKSFGDRTLLDDVSLRVSTSQRLCLVGRNGVGKTTLLRIIAGEMAADSGEVGIPRGWRVALHDQRPPRADGRTLGLYVAELLGDVESIERRLSELEQAMADGDQPLWRRDMRSRCMACARFSSTTLIRITAMAPKPRLRMIPACCT